MTDVFNINYSSIFGGEKATRPNRKLVAAQKQEYLKLPANYQEIPEDEMYYIDGGAWIPVSLISVPIDAFLLFTGIGGILAPIKLLGKTFGKTLAKKVIKGLAPTLSKGIIAAVGFFGGVVTNAAISGLMNLITDNFWRATSLGGVVGLAIDVTDGSVDGRLTW